MPKTALATRAFASGGLLQHILTSAQYLLDALPEDVRRAIATSLTISLPLTLVGSFGAIAYSGYRWGLDRFARFAAKRFQVTMEFKSADKHYDSILDYVGSRCSVETGRIVASTQPRQRETYQEMLARWFGGNSKAPTLYYQPELQGIGATYFNWTDDEGLTHRIWISHTVERPQFRSDSGKEKRDPETLYLTMWWTTDSSILKKFLATALRTMLKDESSASVDIYVKHSWFPMWTKAISRERRDRATVILDEGLADFVVDDMKHFFTQKTADWYHNAGIPYRRGYLLYGPPGCGKTSFAQVLAGELSLDVCLMNLSNSEMNDDDLAELLRAAPPRSMLLLEDVDAIFVERSAASDKKSRGGGVSFSGLLNALDGAAAQEGCVLVLTTNHKDRLDEALIRPGRCDVHVLIEKASQDQAKRMFWRFFGNAAEIKLCGSPVGTITTCASHGLSTGDTVMYKKSSADPLVMAGKEVEDGNIFYVRMLGSAQLALYETLSQSTEGGKTGMLMVTGGGKGCKLTEQSDKGVRFSNRIPDKQVSMAKLQGYLMKQKLLAETDFKRRRDEALVDDYNVPDDNDEEFKFRQAVRLMASDSAVMNVHELLDVKKEVPETRMHVYDHFRRVGLHQFSAVFEHYGIHVKQDLSDDLLGRIDKWHPDLKVLGPLLDRLKHLIKGDSALDSVYSLADLSVLRDRFLDAYKDADHATVEEGNPSMSLCRAVSEPTKPEQDAKMIARVKLLRASSQQLEDRGLKLLAMAHQFQENLETNGKTHVTMWQLDMHFKRYEGDPVGALAQCQHLRKSSANRTPREREAQWMTTFGFLRRIGLEKYAFELEDKGYKFWVDWKHLSKDEIKAQAGMSPQEAQFCHAVLVGDMERPDLLRKFQLPEFFDITEFFRERFPSASPSSARRFARELTDELGATTFSCYQIQKYLQDVKDVAEALGEIGKGLLREEDAQSLRTKPEPPPAPSPPTAWIFVWLKENDLEDHFPAFLGQALSTRDDILDAPLDHVALEKMGINKIGHRCKILRLIEKEKSMQNDP